jgi:uncharacterized protein (TIGR03085 family)
MPYHGGVSAIDLARAERAALCDLLEEIGPDEPTLCSGWTTRDLTAHLVVREGRPDAALGGLGGPLAAWTEKVHSDAASQPFDKLVRIVRTGPPIWSYFRVPFADGQLNTVEFFVHHEDVRRSRDDWEARDLDPNLSNFLWDRLKLGGRLLFNGVKGGVVLQRTDGPDGEIEVHRAKSGKPKVTLTGTAGELVMIAYGRHETDVLVEGDAEAVAAFREATTPVDEAEAPGAEPPE